MDFPSIIYARLIFDLNNCTNESSIKDGSTTAATSKMEHFVIIVNGWKPLTIITKSSILDVTAVLDPPLSIHIQLTRTISI